MYVFGIFLNLARYIVEQFLALSSHIQNGGAGAYLQQSMGEGRGTPWTDLQSVTGQSDNGSIMKVVILACILCISSDKDVEIQASI